MHSLIKEYVETSEPFELILKRFCDKEPLNMMYSKLYEIKIKQISPRVESDDFDFDDNFLLEKKYDKELILLFYQLSATLAYYYHKSEIGHLLFKRANTYIDKNTPPYLMLPTKANILKGQEFINFIEDHLEKYAHTSPRYSAAIEIYYFRLACMGVPAKESLIKKYLESKSFTPNLNRIEMSKFVGYIETFELEKIEKSKAAVFSKDFSIGEGSSQYLEILPHYKLLYQVLFEHEKWPESHFEMNKNILSMYYIMTRQNQKALLTAKQTFTYDLSAMVTFTLVRCELVNKNFESASRCLKKFIEEGEEHFLIYFFYSRIEIARGNRELAKQYFSNSLALSRKINSEGLLNFELSLSYELSISDLRYLLENPTKVNTNEISLGKVINKSNVQKNDIIIGNSLAIQEIKEKITSYANSNIPVLITGETGVGKDLVAKMLHQQSIRKTEAFYAINCGSLSESLLLSELFGHEAGAFTGASKAHKGLFEAVEKGTIFLDEIGEISTALQVALLRVLDQNEFKPVGSNTFKKCQCRILFATNADLEQMVEDKKFRKDLLFRLKRLEISLPALRNRKEDIPELVKYYFSYDRSDQKTPVISAELMRAFQKYSWPGNIRQLKNEIEKMRVMQSEKLSYDLPDFPFQNEVKLQKNKIENEEGAEPKNVQKGRIPFIEDVLSASKSSIRRIDNLKELFQIHKKFTRKELIEITKFAPKTVTRDLERLCEEGFILRIMPNATARTHYFVLNNDGL
jgi:DNA-binding NtrC family response regulator